MRPYRGMTKDGKLVYGWYVNDTHHNQHIIIPDDCGFGFDGINFYAAAAEVIPETVCQQIGLKDKNGKEAYESNEIMFWTITGGKGKGIIEYEAPTYFVRMKTGARYEFSELSDFEIIHDKE